MNEKRHKPRQPMQWKGLIVDLAGKPLCPCTLVNVSTTGARLILKAPIEVPECFTLLLSKHGAVRRQCEVMWHSDQDIGVRFIVEQPGEHEAGSFVDDTLARIAAKS